MILDLKNINAITNVNSASKFEHSIKLKMTTN